RQMTSLAARPPEGEALLPRGGGRASRPEGPPIILVTGVTGQVGHELVRSLQPLGKLVAMDSRALDLADAAAVAATLASVAPAVVVNPAAYTAVDKAEAEVERARAINAT